MDERDSGQGVVKRIPIRVKGGEGEMPVPSADEGAALTERGMPPMDYQEEYLRLRAEMENRQRRLKESYEGRLREEKAELLRLFLAVMDSLERALAHRDGETGLRQGLELTYRQMRKFLAEEGVEEFPALGQPFDPRYHEAVEILPGAGEPTVLKEWEKGYLYGGKLLRPARVRVVGS
ncbi:MAG: nucleotide exchange factor GrpE [Chloroflexota bacterium]|nr:nucleotide exchange factor GrpE [Chloroflexota bacterium]